MAEGKQIAGCLGQPLYLVHPHRVVLFWRPLVHDVIGQDGEWKPGARQEFQQVAGIEPADDEAIHGAWFLEQAGELASIKRGVGQILCWTKQDGSSLFGAI